jgi:hypothetical protein
MRETSAFEIVDRQMAMRAFGSGDEGERRSYQELCCLKAAAEDFLMNQ